MVLMEGLRLTAVGMGAVFFLLVLLVLAMHLSAFFLRGRGGPAAGGNGMNGAEAGEPSLETIAVAIAAVQAYAKRR